MSTPSLDESSLPGFVAELWEKMGLPSKGPHSSALSMLLVFFANRDPIPAMTLTYDFQEGGQLREYRLRDRDGRLLLCVAFRPDGSVVDEPTEIE
jgi:hypothetical protein